MIYSYGQYIQKSTSDRTLTFTNSGYNILLLYKREYFLFRSFWKKKIGKEKFSVIIPTNYESLMSVVSLVQVKSSIYLHKWNKIRYCLNYNFLSRLKIHMKANNDTHHQYRF